MNNLTGKQMMTKLKEAGLIEGDPKELWYNATHGEIGMYISLYQYKLAKLPKPKNPVLGDLWKYKGILRCWSGKKWISGT